MLVSLICHLVCSHQLQFSLSFNILHLYMFYFFFLMLIYSSYPYDIIVFFHVPFGLFCYMLFPFSFNSLHLYRFSCFYLFPSFQMRFSTLKATPIIFSFSFIWHLICSLIYCFLSPSLFFIFTVFLFYFFLPCTDVLVCYLKLPLLYTSFLSYGKDVLWFGRFLSYGKVIS